MTSENPTVVLAPNRGKQLEIDVDGVHYARLPVRTHVVMATDDIAEIFKRYLTPHLKEGDMIFASEKVVGITQGRAFPIKDIKPSALAKFLCRFVTKTPSGIGIGSPWTMELAIREAGAARILLAALVAAVTKPFGVKGLFYRVCGRKVAAIDGPCSYTLPPYNEYASLGPANPDRTARELSQAIGHPVVIIDANDLGVEALGRSDKGIKEAFCQAVFRDNPLGQTDEQTPLCIVRKT